MTRLGLVDRRQFLLGSLAGLGAVALGSCRSGRSGRSGGPGGTGTVRLPWGALGFPSPFASNGALGYNQMSLLYDTLLWKDGNGELLPWLAQRFEESPDHLTYTFTLRPDVRWSDGRPLTADDVVFTFEYYGQQDTLAPPVIIQPPKGIAKVRSTDPRTVEITLASPRVTFLEQVAGALPIIPKHVWSSIKGNPADALDRKVLVGSGPYRLRSYKGDGEAMLYTARDGYYLGTPFIERIEMRAIEDQFGALLGRDIDVARGVGLRADVLARFEGDAGYGMLTEQGSTGSMLYWNLGKEGPLADVRFRRACAHAINRQELVARLAAGRGRPGSAGFLGPANPSVADVEQYAFDVRAANALLDATGFAAGPSGVRRGPRGNPLSFELLINNEEAPLAELLVAALRTVGVDLRPNPVQLGPHLFGNKLVGAFDMAVLAFPGPAPGGPNADPDVLRQLFSSKLPPSLMSAASYANPAFDTLADQQLLTFDAVERRRIVAQMQQILAVDLPVLPLYYPETALVFREAVLDQWYFTPGQFPASEDNKQLFVTGQKAGLTIRSR